MPRVALFEIGTNSLKCLITEVRSGRPRQLHFSVHITRIGRGVRANGRVTRAALDATTRAIRGCRRLTRHYGADHTFAFATYALRKAANASRVTGAIERAAGAPLHIISGTQEARFAYASARAALRLQRHHTLLLDIGGGSTEVVHAIGGVVQGVRSVPLGALHLTERFIHSDPIDDAEFRRAERHITSVARRALGAVDAAGIAPEHLDLVASGGTVTTSARVIAAAARRSFPAPGAAAHGGARRSGRRPAGGFRIALGDVDRFIDTCLARRLGERRRIRGLDPERADIIPAGLAVMRSFMRETRKRVLFPNAGGVRDGVLASLIENDFEWPR